MTAVPATSPGTTADYLAGFDGWWRPRLTPAHASWLNQGELLNNAFGGRYLRRGSWASREEYIAHVAASWPEYNRLYAHPFEWTWTNQKMRRWFAVMPPEFLALFRPGTLVGHLTRLWP